MQGVRNPPPAKRISFPDDPIRRIVDRTIHTVAELQVLDREVNDGRVLLQEEVVLCEALDVKYHVLWQRQQLVRAGLVSTPLHIQKNGESQT